jgi:hypothetical protein
MDLYEVCDCSIYWMQYAIHDCGVKFELEQNEYPCGGDEEFNININNQCEVAAG